jgi:hypothetical protein
LEGHPDVGGTAEMFCALVEARDRLLPAHHHRSRPPTLRKEFKSFTGGASVAGGRLARRRCRCRGRFKCYQREGPSEGAHLAPDLAQVEVSAVSIQSKQLREALSQYPGRLVGPGDCLAYP